MQKTEIHRNQVYRLAPRRQHGLRLRAFLRRLLRRHGAHRIHHHPENSI